MPVWSLPAATSRWRSLRTPHPEWWHSSSTARPAASLRMCRSVHEVRCSPDRSLFDAYQDLRRRGALEEYRFLMRLSTKSPLLRDVGADSADRFLRCEEKTLPEEDGAPLLLCASVDGSKPAAPRRPRPASPRTACARRRVCPPRRRRPYAPASPRAHHRAARRGKLLDGREHHAARLDREPLPQFGAPGWVPPPATSPACRDVAAPLSEPLAGRILNDRLGHDHPLHRPPKRPPYRSTRPTTPSSPRPKSESLIRGIVVTLEYRIYKTSTPRGQPCKYLQLVAARDARGLLRIVDTMRHLAPHFVHQRPDLQLTRNARPLVRHDVVVHRKCTWKACVWS